MLRRPIAPNRTRSVLLLGAIALVAAACGSGGQAPTDALTSGQQQGVTTAAPVVESSAAGAAPEAESTADEQALTLPTPVPAANGADAATGAAEQTTATTATAGAPNPSTTAPASTAAPTTAAPTTAAPVANNFPAVAVQRIADGAQVNANDQLGGGARPVLLWFWSPF